MKSLYHFLSLIALLITLTASSQEYNYYFGNIHAHSDFSDGNQERLECYDTPLESFESAKKSMHMDFLGISEHNHSKAKGGVNDSIRITTKRFKIGLKSAKKASKSGEFVALYGIEWGLYKSGHVLIYGTDQLFNWEEDNADILVNKSDYIDLFTKINECDGCFAYLAHPKKSNFDDLFNRDYQSPEDSAFRIIANEAIVGLAIRNGPSHEAIFDYKAEVESNYEVRFRQLLANGFHVGVGIDHDNHYTNFGRSTKSRLVILAKELNQESLLDALRNRRFYASDDWDAQVKFEINGNTMGSIVASTEQIKIYLKIEDSKNEITEDISIYYGIAGSGKKAKILKQFKNTDEVILEPKLETNMAYYFYAKITQKEEKGDKLKDIIWTSPIWYTIEN